MVAIDELIDSVSVPAVRTELRLSASDDVIPDGIIEQDIETAAFIVSDHSDGSASPDEMRIATRVVAAYQVLDADQSQWITQYQELDLTADVDIEQRRDVLREKRDRVLNMLTTTQPEFHSVGGR